MDEIYLNKILGGQTGEFRYFIETYKNFAFNLALSVVKNELDAEDVVQEAFIRAYNSLSSFNKKSKFSSWLYRIVVNCAYQQLDKSKRLKSESSHEDEIPIVTINPLIDYYEEEEKKYCIEQALNLLNPDESLVLNLYYLLDNKIKEISEITGWSVSKTKVTLHRARKTMKEAMLEVFSKHKITL